MSLCVLVYLTKRQCLAWTKLIVNFKCCALLELMGRKGEMRRERGRVRGRERKRESEREGEKERERERERE